MSHAPHVLVAAPLADAGPGGPSVALPDGALHHLRRVLRLPDGADLSLTDGAGATAAGRLTGDEVHVVGPVVSAPAPRPRLVLAQALAKGRRVDDAVRAACELGVDAVVPVVAERTQGRPDAHAADAVRSRWHALAVAALEQSRGVRLATVATPVTADALAAGASTVPDVTPERGGLRVVTVPGAAPLPDVLAPRLADAATVVVAVGPEGGWSAAEEAAFAAAGWVAAGLGPTVLRTEHAGPAALAVAAALAGRWAGGPAATLPPRPSRSPGTL